MTTLSSVQTVVRTIQSGMYEGRKVHSIWEYRNAGFALVGPYGFKIFYEGTEIRHLAEFVSSPKVKYVDLIYPFAADCVILRTALRYIVGGTYGWSGLENKKAVAM